MCCYVFILKDQLHQNTRVINPYQMGIITSVWKHRFTVTYLNVYWRHHGWYISIGFWFESWSLTWQLGPCDIFPDSWEDFSRQVWKWPADIRPRSNSVRNLCCDCIMMWRQDAVCFVDYLRAVSHKDRLWQYMAKYYKMSCGFLPSWITLSAPNTSTIPLTPSLPTRNMYLLQWSALYFLTP